MTAVATIPQGVTLARLNDPIAIKVRESAAQFTPFLPLGTDVEHVVAQVFLEVQRVPQLAKCDPATIVSAASRLVSWGFDIGRTGYLVPFGNTCTGVPGYKGFIEMVLASGAASECTAREVYEGDHFEYEFGTNDFLRHVPCNSKNRGKLTHFYVIWKVKYGHKKFDVMSVEDVETIRQKYSKQWARGPLEAWYGIKTVIRRSAKLLPQNPKLAKFFAAISGDEEQELGAPVLTKIEAEVTASDVPSTPVVASESDTGEAATDKQLALMGMLAKSHHFTDGQRAKLIQRIDTATKEQAMALIDSMTAHIKAGDEREREEKRAAKEAEAAALPGGPNDLPF